MKLYLPILILVSLFSWNSYSQTHPFQSLSFIDIAKKNRLKTISIYHIGNVDPITKDTVDAPYNNPNVIKRYFEIDSATGVACTVFSGGVIDTIVNTEWLINLDSAQFYGHNDWIDSMSKYNDRFHLNHTWEYDSNKRIRKVCQYNKTTNNLIYYWFYTYAKSGLPRRVVHNVVNESELRVYEFFYEYY
ncbi:MAG: hypothetical protein HRT72_09100 [Flavobacteriales bacterium]|nr:hypothetical protein [Flavobacteriales bacterium]